MYLDFAVSSYPTRVAVRFKFSLRVSQSTGREHVRLINEPPTGSCRPGYYAEPVAYVCRTVGQPRRRVSLSATVTRIAAALHRVTGTTWYCLNYDLACHHVRTGTPMPPPPTDPADWPESLQALEVSSPDYWEEDTPEDEPEDWECRNCGYENEDSESLCGDCGWTRETWRCEVNGCHFYNPSDATHCRSCGVSRAAALLGVGPGPAWTCGCCFRVNPANAALCERAGCGGTRLMSLTPLPWVCQLCGCPNSTHRAGCGRCGRRYPGVSGGATRAPVVSRPPTVHDHGYHPSVQWQLGAHEGPNTTAMHAPSGGLPFYGVELEIDDVRGHGCDPTSVPALAYPLFYCKGDGSLRNGVEMVSHPSTEAWWREQEVKVTNLLKQLRQHGWQSHDAKTCGLHIHIGRTAFQGSLHLYRFLSLVYRSPKLSLCVSQRAPAQLNQWARLEPSRRKAVKAKAGLGYMDRNRYEAVNMTEQTAEVRMFRGTLQPSRFYKCLEFCWAALRFTLETERIRSCTAKYFLPWLGEQRDTYPHLVEFLNETEFKPSTGARYSSETLGDADSISPSNIPLPLR